MYSFNKKILYIFLLISIIFSLPIFKNISNIGLSDWDQHLAYAEANRKTIIEYHQLPLWNPYRCGGMSEIANPQNRFLSPLFIFPLLVGPIIGYKLIFFFMLFIGLCGTYLLGRYFSISRNGSILISIVFNCSGLFLLPFITGMMQFMGLHLLSWITLFYLEATDNEKLLINKSLYIGVLITSLFFLGFHYIGMLFLYLFVLSVFYFLKTKNLLSFKIFVVSLFIFLGLSAVKLLPTLEMLHQYPRFTNQRDGYTVTSLLYGLFSQQQTFNEFTINFHNIVPSFINGATYDLEENGMYIGLLSGFLFVIGFLSISNKHRIFIRSGYIFFLLLIFGNFFIPSLYQYIHMLPVFNMMRIAQRYRYFFMVFFTLCIGMGYDRLFKTNIRKMSPSIIYLIKILIIIVISADIWLINWKSEISSFTYKPISLPKQASFKQTSQGAGQEYLYTKANYGIDDFCYEQLIVPRGKTKKNGQNEYKGEQYLLDYPNISLYTTWTPNWIYLKLPSSIDNTKLIINQNYDSNWFVLMNNKTVRHVEKYNDLLAVSISKSDTSIIFFYLPILFVIGCFISTLFFSIILIYGIKQALKRK